MKKINMSKLLKFCCAAAVVVVIPCQVNAAELKGTKSSINTDFTKDGYISAKYIGGESKKIKVTIENAGVQYKYDLSNTGASEKFPLQLGNGTYQVRVMQNTSGNKYVAIQTEAVQVSMPNPFAPFLTSTQFINFDGSNSAVAEAKRLTKGITDPLEKADVIYNYVTDLIAYDDALATSVQPGYVPDINNVMKTKTGICFDYSAVMASMLRSQNIPTKLVMGYVSPNGLYHAWNEIYIEGRGWVKTGNTYFGGKQWQLTDATFLHGNKDNKDMISFLANDKNYSEKYIY